MKLNPDCVRDLMLYFETETEIHKSVNVLGISVGDYTIEEIIYTTEKLLEADYLKGNIIYADNRIWVFLVSSLTFNGHTFVDSIRDNGVWKKTKDILSKLGSFSIAVLSEVVVSVLAEKIHK